MENLRDLVSRDAQRSAGFTLAASYRDCALRYEESASRLTEFQYFFAQRDELETFVYLIDVVGI